MKAELAAGLQWRPEFATIWLGLFLFYLVNYFVIVFFNVALMSAATELLAGRPATLRGGLSVAWARKEKSSSGRSWPLRSARPWGIDRGARGAAGPHRCAIRWRPPGHSPVSSSRRCWRLRTLVPWMRCVARRNSFAKRVGRGSGQPPRQHRLLLRISNCSRLCAMAFRDCFGRQRHRNRSCHCRAWRVRDRAVRHERRAPGNLHCRALPVRDHQSRSPGFDPDNFAAAFAPKEKKSW